MGLKRRPDRSIMTCRRSEWIMFQYQSGHRKWRGGERVLVLDADGFKLLPLSSISHEAFTFLIFHTVCGGLMFWVNELSVHLLPLASLFSLPAQGWDVGTATVKHKQLQRLPLLPLCTARCLWGCNYQSPHEILRDHAYDPPLLLPRLFLRVFLPFFLALLAMTHGEVFAGRGVNSLYMETPVWPEQHITSAYSPFNQTLCVIVSKALMSLFPLFVQESASKVSLRWSSTFSLYILLCRYSYVNTFISVPLIKHYHIHCLQHL